MRTLLKYIGLVAIFFPAQTLAHVGYILSEETIQQKSGFDREFFLRALSDPTNTTSVLVILGILFLMYFLNKKVRIINLEVAHIQQTAKSYTIFLPWIIRLSLGIALIGAGISNNLISPALSGYPEFSFLQILVGFLLLLGFLVLPATIITATLIIFAITQNPYMLGGLDLLAMSIVLLLLADERPGLDHILGLPFPHFFQKESVTNIIPLILRLGIGGAMIFLAIYEKFLHPYATALVVQEYNLTSVLPVSPEAWVLGSGTIELLIGIFLILGLQTRLTSVIAFFVLSLSFFYFGEDVYSHITLFGILSILLITGAGRFSLDERKPKPTNIFSNSPENESQAIIPYRHRFVNQKDILIIFCLLFSLGTYIFFQQTAKTTTLLEQNEIPKIEGFNSHGVYDVSGKKNRPAITALQIKPDPLGGYNVYIQTQNFIFDGENAGKQHRENSGHVHLFLNGEKITRMYGNWQYLNLNLQPGMNILRAELNTNDHRVYLDRDEAVHAEVKIKKDS